MTSDQMTYLYSMSTAILTATKCSAIGEIVNEKRKYKDTSALNESLQAQSRQVFREQQAA